MATGIPKGMGVVAHWLRHSAPSSFPAGANLDPVSSLFMRRASCKASCIKPSGT